MPMPNAKQRRRRAGTVAILPRGRGCGKRAGLREPTFGATSSKAAATAKITPAVGKSAAVGVACGAERREESGQIHPPPVCARIVDSTAVRLTTAD